MKRTVLAFLILLIASVAVFAQSGAPMLFRQPTMNKTDIVFVFAGDLWRVSRGGGGDRERRGFCRALRGRGRREDHRATRRLVRRCAPLQCRRRP